MQKIIKDYNEIEKYLNDNSYSNILVVCSHSFYKCLEKIIAIQLLR